MLIWAFADHPTSSVRNLCPMGYALCHGFAWRHLWTFPYLNPFLCSLIEMKYSPAWPLVLPPSLNSASFIAASFCEAMILGGEKSSNSMSTDEWPFLGVRGEEELSGEGDSSPLCSNASLSRPLGSWLLASTLLTQPKQNLNIYFFWDNFLLLLRHGSAQGEGTFLITLFQRCEVVTWLPLHKCMQQTIWSNQTNAAFSLVNHFFINTVWFM